MKNKNILVILLIIGIILSGIYIGLNGIKIGKLNIPRAKEAIDLGLDLAGGVYVVLEADTDAVGEDLSRLMQQTQTIIEERVNGLGVAEPNISIEGNDRIRIELAGLKDPKEAIDIIGKTAQLRFIDPDGNIVITGKNIKEAEVVIQSGNGISKEEPMVSLKFDDEGKQKFATVTGELIHNKNIEDRIITIELDSDIISSPAVAYIKEGGEAITGGEAVITGDFTIESASHLATLIRGGALPVDMIEHQTSVIGPTLGLEAFEKSIKAGAIALLMIFIFMIVVYKLPGVVATLGLIAYTIITIYIMAILGVKLTLPGIAGLILSIGMAVDANVLIFERIREELIEGKTVRASIDFGFNKALTSVIDSNVTTLIAGIALYIFGVGPIRGFGVTLIIGILVSIFTSVILSKILLTALGNIFNKNKKIYGV